MENCDAMTKIDLHTIRMTERNAAAEYAISQDNWAFIGVSSEEGKDNLDLALKLERLGKNVYLVCPECGLCPECSNPMPTISGQPVFKSIELINEPVDVICIQGEMDYWSLTDSISQRMQWFGDIMVICSPTGYEDNRWVSEMYDFGIAVAYHDDIAKYFEN